MTHATVTDDPAHTSLPPLFLPLFPSFYAVRSEQRPISNYREIPHRFFNGRGARSPAPTSELLPNWQLSAAIINVASIHVVRIVGETIINPPKHQMLLLLHRAQLAESVSPCFPRSVTRVTSSVLRDISAESINGTTLPILLPAVTVSEGTSKGT